MISPLRSRRHEARAVNSRNLSWAESHVSDIDVLTARGMSGSSLGADLERLKYGYDRSAYEGCVDQLATKFKRSHRRRISINLVHAALHEFLDDICHACGGRATIQLDVDEFSRCDACNGTGQRRHTDADRAHAASVKLFSWRHHEPDYLALLGCIDSAINSHRRGMTRALADIA
jgi:hypothetical protein